MTDQKQKVIVTVGPIPGKLDSVKIITNKFKGMLSYKTALKLARYNDVTIVKYENTELPKDNQLKVINVSDVYSYYNKLIELAKTNEYHFVLSAAVANLVPLHPYVGKFPSHNYKVGDRINIPFTIAPRAVDEIKKVNPTKTLISYKLFDGTEEELLQAGWKQLCQSRSNIVFCNHPNTAKDFKFAITADGSTIKMSFDEHIDWIDRVINLNFFKTEVTNTEVDQSIFNQEILEYCETYIYQKKGDLSLGCIAFRDPYNPSSFFTNARGKQSKELVKVNHVDFQNYVVHATKKPALNAPFLAKIFEDNPDCKAIIHWHSQKRANCETVPYIFHGSEEDDIIKIPNKNMFAIDFHGYYKTFNDNNQMKIWLDNGSYNIQ